MQLSFNFILNGFWIIGTFTHMSLEISGWEEASSTSSSESFVEDPDDGSPFVLMEKVLLKLREMNEEISTVKREMRRMENRTEDVMKNLELDIKVTQENISTELNKMKSIVSVDECESVPCRNAAACVDEEGINRFQCICRRGYTGYRCELCAHGFRREGLHCIYNPRAFSRKLQSFGKERKSWLNAKTACNNLGGDLASCETDDEWNHLYSEMKKVDGQNMHWLGATGNGKKGGWTWITGRNITSSPSGIGAWRRGQPNQNRRSCLISNWPKYGCVTENWWDNNCSFLIRYVCEFKTLH